jgi:hypothetical protein
MTTDAADAQDDPDDGPLEIDDPDDYNQARRLQAIHQARDDVRKARENTTAGRAPANEHITTHQELAEAVAVYGYELLPLMDEAGWEYETGDGTPFDTIRDFIYAMGHPDPLDIDAEYIPKSTSMAVYGRLNGFMHEVGLGADFDDSDNEWNV